MSLLCCVAAVGLHLGSLHVAPYPGAPDLNGVNPGVYVELKNQLVLGSYYNSVRRQSAYVGYNWHLGTGAGKTEFSLLTGAITGYPRAKVLPLVVPSVRFYLGENYGFRVSYIPKIPATQAHVLHFTYEYRF